MIALGDAMTTDTLRQIFGTLRTPNGSAFPNKSLKWFRERRTAVAQGSSVVLDDPFILTTDAAGQISASVMAGAYLVLAPLSDEDRYFRVVVPDQAGPFDISSLIDGPTVEPDDLTQFEALVAKAKAWAAAPEDSVVESGEFSAKHYAAKAEEERLGAQTAVDTAVAAALAKAEEWAENPEDVEVEAGQYSAKHWAAKSEDERLAAQLARAGAETAEANAESARDSAFVNAAVYADTAAGLAATTVGDQFQVVSGDEIIRYRHDAGPVATEVARYPAMAKIASKADISALDVLTRQRQRIAQADGILDSTARGVDLAVDFYGATNGVEAHTVSSPPMVKVAGTFNVQNGRAVAAAGTSLASPAIMAHDPAYGQAITHMTVYRAGDDEASRRTGVLIAADGAVGALWWGYRPSNGNLELWRLQSGTSTNVAGSPTGLAAGQSWTITVERGIDNATRAIIEMDNGEMFTGPWLTRPEPWPAAWGAVSAQAGGSIGMIEVLTSYSAVVDRVSAAERKLRRESALAGVTPAGSHFNDRAWRSTILKDGRAFDLRAEQSEAILVDYFESPDGTPVGTGAADQHAPDFCREHLPCGYTVWGTMPWQVLDGALAGVPPMSQAQYHGTGVAAITWPLSRQWMESARGVEFSFSIDTAATIQGQVGCFIRVPGRAYMIWIDGSRFRIVWRGDEFVSDGSTGDTLVTQHHGLLWPQKDLRVVVRAYEGGGIICQIGDQTLAWGFGINPMGLEGMPIEAVGVCMDPRFGSQEAMRFRDFTVKPIPAVGATRWRSLPPEPAPVIPQFTKHGVVFDIASADTGLGMLNFSVVPMHSHAAALGITPIDNYYAYYSTDHDLGDGGIFLATAPTPLGPWTRQGAAGQAGNILTDGSNRQAETPVVHYDPETNRLLMIYHIYMTAGVNRQQSKVAESADGINWNIIDYIYPWAGTSLDQVHARHTGYMSWGRDPLGVVPGWVGWSRLFGGADTSLCATTRSLDGVHWEMDFLPVDFPFLMGHIEDTRVVHNHGYATQPFAYQGQRLLPVAPFRSIAVGNNKGYIGIVRLGDDMRNMSAHEAIPFPLTEPDELARDNVISGVMVEDDILYLYYQSNAKSIRLATADLTLDPDGNARPF